MKCPKCGAWSLVMETRERDGGHRMERRRECANGHRFSTTEIHRPVWCSAKQRQAAFLRTIGARVALARRNAEIVRLLAAGEPGVAIAARLGVSPDTVSLVKRTACRAESAHAVNEEPRNHPGPEPRAAGRGREA